MIEKLIVINESSKERNLIVKDSYLLHLDKKTNLTNFADLTFERFSLMLYFWNCLRWLLNLSLLNNRITTLHNYFEKFTLKKLGKFYQRNFFIYKKSLLQSNFLL